jgi:hypothetical protein
VLVFIKFDKIRSFLAILRRSRCSSTSRTAKVPAGGSMAFSCFRPIPAAGLFPRGGVRGQICPPRSRHDCQRSGFPWPRSWVCPPRSSSCHRRFDPDGKFAQFDSDHFARSKKESQPKWRIGMRLCSRRPRTGSRHRKREAGNSGDQSFIGLWPCWSPPQKYAN